MAQCDNRFHFIVAPSSEEARALLLPGASGWTLPWYHDSQPVLWADVGHINAAAQRMLDLEAATLYCVGVAPALDRPCTDFAYAMEPLNPSWRPPAEACWVAVSDLQHMHLALPEQRAFLRDWFRRECDAEPRPLRPPWYRPGWFAKASVWLREQLSEIGAGATHSIEQVRSCSRSAVLRAGTASGTVYLKAVPAMFGHELPLTSELAQQYRDCLPQVITLDEDRRWLLMSDAGNQDLGATWASSLPERCLRSYAQIQIDQSASVKHWLGQGCPDHRLNRIAEGLEALLADVGAMQPDDSPVSLTADEIGRLQSLAPTLRRLCEELAASEVPYSLEHGDLWTQQVFTRGGQFTISDWSDTTVSHPFFSLCYFFGDRAALESELARCGQADVDAGELCARLTQAYLEPWTAFESMERLRSLLGLAHRLVGLHLALLYHQHILPGLEQRWEMHRMLPHFLRRVLRALEAGTSGGRG